MYPTQQHGCLGFLQKPSVCAAQCTLHEPEDRHSVQAALSSTPSHHQWWGMVELDLLTQNKCLRRRLNFAKTPCTHTQQVRGLLLSRVGHLPTQKRPACHASIMTA